MAYDSGRVEGLLVDAITLMAFKCFGERLSQDDARWLAQLGSVAEVHKRLKERLPVRRITPGIETTKEFQRHLAIIEIGASSLPSSEQRQLVDRLLTAEAKRQERAKREQAQTLNIERQIGQLAESTPRLRLFLRKARRLYAEQTGQLAVAIDDEQELNNATLRLNDVYASFFSRAVARVDAG
jgi:hypothetical protein